MPEDTQHARIFRDRIQLTSTVKEGWRVGEVTNEVTYQDGDEPTDAERLAWLRETVRRGQHVVDELNNGKESA
jgi:hypothetical protein